MSIPQYDSQLIRVIASDGGLRERILGVILTRAEANEATLSDTERQIFDDFGGEAMETLCEEVASNATIYTKIKTAIVGGDIATGIQAGLADDDLTFVVTQELPRLAP